MRIGTGDAVSSQSAARRSLETLGEDEEPALAFAKTCRDRGWCCCIKTDDDDESARRDGPYSILACRAAVREGFRSIVLEVGELGLGDSRTAVACGGG